MKEIIINEPDGRLYGDPDFKRAFNKVLNEIEQLVPPDRSSGNLAHKGNGAMAVAKVKALRNAVDSLLEITKAITVGRQ
jgi:hypothetical protein